MEERVIVPLETFAFKEMTSKEAAYQAILVQLREHAFVEREVVGRPDMIHLQLLVSLPKHKAEELLPFKVEYDEQYKGLEVKDG